MRVVILNWRDVRSPRAGGAERITHEVARRLVARGHEVTWISSGGDGLPESETLDGVELIRRGSELTTRVHAPRLVRDAAPDVVLEEINTLPYFGPVWSRSPVLLYMNQLARGVWWYEAPLPVAAVGWLLEPVCLQAYRRCDAITISASSRDDLRRLGIGGSITIAPMAVHAEFVEEPARRSLEGALVAIGRLAPSKRLDHAIDALSILVHEHPDASLTIIGDGRDRERLEQLVERKGVGGSVRFLGRIDETEKVAVLDASDVLVGTSVREGWGLTVTEAAARGVPAVVYDIPGFRDAVVNDRTGVVVQPAVDNLAEGIDGLLDDRARYERLQRGALSAATPLSYDATADAFEQALSRAADTG